MPIIRITKLDPTLAITEPKKDMDLKFIRYDQQAYLFDWTGRNGLLPLDALRQALNRRLHGKDFRQLWIAPDGDFVWGDGDEVQIVSSRLGMRLPKPIKITHEVRYLGLASPYDRLMFFLDGKPTEFSIDIYINPLSDGESGQSEFMQVNSK